MLLPRRNRLVFRVGLPTFSFTWSGHARKRSQVKKATERSYTSNTSHASSASTSPVDTHRPTKFQPTPRGGIYLDEIADREGLEYGLVGSFAARFNGTTHFSESRFNGNTNDIVVCHEIEILIEPEALSNRCKTLTAIMHRNQSQMGITQLERPRYIRTQLSRYI